MHAFCTGGLFALFASPSMVTTSLPCTSLIFSRHERVARWLIRTVQEPQWPSPQLYLVPVRPRSVRSTHNSGRSPSTLSLTSLSFSLNDTVSFMLSSGPDFLV